MEFVSWWAIMNVVVSEPRKAKNSFGAARHRGGIEITGSESVVAISKTQSYKASKVLSHALLIR